MKKLGYSLTWTTTCFLDGGCGRVVWAHTNGHGDFVLFDDLGWPWPIHDCYGRRFAPGNPELAEFVATQAVEFGAPVPSPSWEFVVRIDPETTRKKRFRIVGTVTNVERGITGKLPAFRDARTLTKEELSKALEGRNSLVTIVTGDGEEFDVFVDTREHNVDFGDIVGANLKVRALLSGKIFVATVMKVFRMGQGGAEF